MVTKFRGYDKDVKRWTYGYYVYHEDTTYCCAPLEEDKKHHYIIFDRMTDWNLPNKWLKSEVDGESVGQFTGIYDIKKREVYVGDRVRVYDRVNDYKFEGIVSFENGSFMIDSRIIRHYRWMDYEVEVIGNIYENP